MDSMKAKITKPRTRPAPNPFDRAVGARIRAKFHAAELTDHQLAHKIGKSVSQVYRYCSGDSRVDPEMLAKLAKVLGCKASDFVDGIRVSSR